MRTPRIDRMRERHFNTTPCITAEHLVLQTQAYKQFAGDAVPVFRAKVVNHILNSVQDGDIVLMHDIYEPTAEAVAELVPALQERGYQLVTVSELFKFRGVTPQAGQYYRSLPPQQTD